jgi:hypothetical protein
MKHNRWIILAIVACLAISVGSYFWATGMIDSLTAYRSPLHSDPPAPGASLGTPLTRRLVFIIIDALRVDTSLNPQVMPVLNNLRQNAAWTTTHSHTPSYSEPGYSVLLIGAWPDLSDGPAMNEDYSVIPTFTQDNLFSAAHRAGLKTAVSGYYWFEKLIPQDTVNAHFYTPGEDKTADRHVVDAALPWLTDPSYQLVLIHIDQVDYAGHHEGGPQDPHWNQAATRADGLLGEILAKLDLSQDTIFVCSDHGQIDSGGHGGPDPVVLIEPFVLAGKGVKPGHAAEVNMVDVAPTMAMLLGLNLPASTEGSVQTDVLALSPDQTAKIKQAEVTQQNLLWQTYQTAVGQQGSDTSRPGAQISRTGQIEAMNEARVSQARWPRVAIVVLLFAVILFALWKTRSEALVWLVTGALAYLIIFNLMYSVVDGRVYSFSSLVSATNLVVSSFINGTVALVLGWAVVVVKLKAFKGGPGKTAGLVAQYLAMIGVLLLAQFSWNFVMNGALVTWALPEMTSFYFGLLALVQLLVVGVLGLVLLGVSALISRFVRQA